MTICVQYATSTVGNTATVDTAFSSLQTVGNTNVVFASAINGGPFQNQGACSDSDGNTYSNPVWIGTQTSSVSGDGASGLWLWVATNIAATNSGAGGRNVVTAGWGGASNFGMVGIMEYPASSGVRVSNYGYSVASSQPSVSLASTATNDTVIAVAAGSTVDYSTLTGGSIGSNAITIVMGHSDTGNNYYWGSEEGASSGGTISATFGAGSHANWSMVALALKPSGGFTSAWQPWTEDAVIVAPKRRGFVQLSSAWEPSPPQPTTFQSWVVQSHVGAPSRRVVPTEQPETWESSPPQPTRFQHWQVDALSGRPNRKPLPWEVESWEPSPPQPTNYQAWAPELGSVKGAPARKAPPWEPDSWEPSPPQPAEFESWAIDIAVKGAPMRRPPPWEGDAWEPSPPQPATFQTWIVDSARWTPRHVPPWEVESWEPSPPQPARFQTWMVDALRGALPRKAPPWEVESWEPSPPQPAEFESWDVAPQRGAAARKAPPWEGDAWEASPPQPTAFQAWLVEPSRWSPRKPPPWETEAWEPSSPQVVRFQSWTTDVTGKRWPQPPLETPWTGAPVSPTLPTSWVFWSNDVPHLQTVMRPADTYLGSSLGWAPAEFQTWAVDVAVHGAPARKAPPWEPEAWEPSSPQVTRFQAWSVDPVSGAPFVRLTDTSPHPFDDFVNVSALAKYCSWATDVPHIVPRVPFADSGEVWRNLGQPALQEPTPPTLFHQRVTLPDAPAWEPSPPQRVKYQAWAIDAVVGRPNRKPLPWEVEAWVSTSPQPARFQTWTVDAITGRPNRSLPSWERDHPWHWTLIKTLLQPYHAYTNDIPPPRFKLRPDPQWEGSLLYFAATKFPAPFSRSFMTAEVGTSVLSYAKDK